MEAIRNYLETMFLNLPNTPEVYKAKNELWQMMEDKYTELKNEGKSENEAVGTVIAEFGNLDELAEDLGIKQFVHQPRQEQTPNAVSLSMEDVRQFLREHSRHSYFVALSIFLFILSACCPIFFPRAWVSSGENVSITVSFISSILSCAHGNPAAVLMPAVLMLHRHPLTVLSG